MAFRTTTTLDSRYGTAQPQTVKTVGRVNIAEASRAKVQMLSKRGADLSDSDPRIGAARALVASGPYRSGFEVGVASAFGTAVSDKEQQTMRYVMVMAGPTYWGGSGAEQGFDVGQALAFGLTKQGLVDKAMALSGNPGTAAGQLVTNGLNDSGLPVDQKTSAMSAVASDGAAREGAAAALGDISAAQNMSLWDKIKNFFGF